MKKLDRILRRDDWKMSNGTLFRYKTAWIPIANFSDDSQIIVFLDLRTAKEIFEIVRGEPESNISLYSPAFSNMKKLKSTDIDLVNETNIKNSLINIRRDVFFDGFKKIGFDYTKSLVSYCARNSCYDILKSCYDEILDIDDYGKYIYLLSKNRDNIEGFKALYRDIQLSQMLDI